ADDVDLASAGQRLELVDSAAALAKQSQEAVGSAHVSGACNHEIDLTASKILFDFRNPVLVTRNDEPLVKRREIAIGFAHSSCNQIDIAPAPIRDHTRAAAIFSTGIDEKQQEHHLALAISQAFEDAIVFFHRFETRDRFGSSAGAAGKESVDAKIKIFCWRRRKH